MAEPAADIILWEETLTCLGELSTASGLLLLLFARALNYQSSGKGTRVVVFRPCDSALRHSPTQLMKSGTKAA